MKALQQATLTNGDNMQKTTPSALETPAVDPSIINHPERRIRLPEVKTLTGYSTSSIYAKMNNGSFPKAQKMGERAIAWRLEDIINFVNSRPFIDCNQAQEAV